MENSSNEFQKGVIGEDLQDNAPPRKGGSSAKEFLSVLAVPHDHTRKEWVPTFI